MTTPPPDPEDATPERTTAHRQLQRSSAARGCLLAGILDGAALLAGIGWVAAVMLDAHRLRSAFAAAFFGFTFAAMAVVAVMLIRGNTPAQRRLRRQHARQLDTENGGE